MNGKNCHHRPRATVAAVGLKLQALQLLAPIREKVKIAQKTLKHGPLDKLQDALIRILAGAHGLCEINTRLRADQAPGAGQADSWGSRDKGWGDVMRFGQYI